MAGLDSRQVPSSLLNMPENFPSIQKIRENQEKENPESYEKRPAEGDEKDILG